MLHVTKTFFHSLFMKSTQVHIIESYWKRKLLKIKQANSNLIQSNSFYQQIRIKASFLFVISYLGIKIICNVFLFITVNFKRWHFYNQKDHRNIGLHWEIFINISKNSWFCKADIDIISSFDIYVSIYEGSSPESTRATIYNQSLNDKTSCWICSHQNFIHLSAYLPVQKQAEFLLFSLTLT